MRGHIHGLDTPHPLGVTLPALFQDDDFTLRLVAGLDEVLAPVFLTLDSQDAYCDPALAPPDFLEWIAAWVGAQLDESWPTERKRKLVKELVGLYRARGTVTGLKALLELTTGAEVEVLDNGAAAWSVTPGADLPGDPAPSLVVRVRGDADPQQIEHVVMSAKPAHVPHVVEVVGG